MQKKSYTDSRLSLKAKGVLAIIEALNGKATRQQIADCCLEQRYTLSSSIMELKANGMIEEISKKDKAGRFAGSYYRLAKEGAGTVADHQEKPENPERGDESDPEKVKTAIPSPAPEEEILVTMIFGNKPVGIPCSYVEKLKPCYPGLDVEQSIRNAAAYAISHEKKYSRSSDWKRYLSNWVRRDMEEKKALDRIRKGAGRSSSPDATGQYDDNPVGVTL